MVEKVAKRKYAVDTVRISARIQKSKIEYLKNMYGVESPTQLLDRIIDEKISNEIPRPNKLRSPIIRVGGKHRIAEKIIKEVPPHRIWVDLFGGSAAISLAKDSAISHTEIINDIDDQIVNLLLVVRDKPLELREKILAMPSSRTYYKMVKDGLTEPKTDIEKAAEYFYLVRNSYFGNISADWDASVTRNKNKTMKRLADELFFVSERMRNMVIENKESHYVIRKYDSEDTLFFIDMPYIHIKGKKDGIYPHKFGVRETRNLAEDLKKIKGKFIVVHYEDELYDKYFLPWCRKVCIPSYNYSARMVKEITIDENGEEKVVMRKKKVNEILYMNF